MSSYQVSARELRYIGGNSYKYYRTYIVDRGIEIIGATQYGRIDTYGHFDMLGAPGVDLTARKMREKTASLVNRGE